MTGSDSKAVGIESSQAPGLTYGFQWSKNVQRGTGIGAEVSVHCIAKYICSCIQIPTK